MAGASPARADSSDAAARDAGAGATASASVPITPPVARKAGPVPYPESAHGDAEVACELVVDAKGVVTTARILVGDEPFASAVLAAAPGFEFDPATRAGVPVASKIRMRVAFSPPARATDATNANDAGDGGVGDAGPPAPAKPIAIEEVTVEGVRKEVGQTTLGGGEVRQIPGAFGDAFRALEALPGVTPIVSGLPFFFVRGAPPGDVGYFIDGVRVPLLYHLGLGPSVIHPGLIDHVDFFPGGYPAAYGRFAGGILSGETLEPATKLHGEGNIRLFDAGALVESPFADGRGTILVGGRYSYTAAVLSLVAPNTKLQYWDYQARATWQLTSRDRIGVFAFGSYDDLETKDDDETDFHRVANTQFHRIDLRWDRKIDDGRFRVALTLGVDSTVFDGDEHSGQAETDELRERSIGGRIEYEKKLAPTVRFRAGADAYLSAFDLVREGYGPKSYVDPQYAAETATPENGTIDDIYPPRDEFVGGVRADIVWKPHPRVEVVPGARVDFFGSKRTVPILPGSISALRGDRTNAFEAAFDPRLAVRVGLDRNLVWVSTFGVSHQPPSFFVPVPGFRPGSLGNGLQTSIQASQGIEADLPVDFHATATVFKHDYLGLNDVTATCINGNQSREDSTVCADEKVRGRTLGVELLVRRDLTKRFTGWLSYTLSRSTRETHALVPGPGLPSAGTTQILSEFDRPHVLNLVGAFDLGRGWRAGMRFFAYSGRPYSRTIAGYPVPPYESERTPPFERLDVRLEKRWRVGETGNVSFVLEGLNVLLQKEVIGVECHSASLPPNLGSLSSLPYDQCTNQTIGPVSVPSIGVEGSF